MKDLLAGVLGLIKGVAEWQIYPLFGNWGWAPEWLETDISRMEQGVKLIFTDPEQVIETIGQNIFDTTDEEGIAYSVGYVTVDIALEILVDKGIDKLKTLNKVEDVIGIAEDTARGIGAEYTITYAEAGEDFVRSVENIADAAEDLSQYAYTAETAGESLLQHLDDIDDISGGVNEAAQGIETGNGTNVLDDVAEGTVKRGTVPGGGTTTLNDWVNKTSDLSNQAPIEIPENATVRVQAKNGYDQITFKWTENGQNYEVRWHTKTPGAPEGQGNTWVVSRVTPGTPTGQARTEHILVRDTWIPRYQWQDAINAYRNGTATTEQLQLLKDGHWQAP